MISVLTPYLDSAPDSLSTARRWRGYLASLAVQRGPCEVLVASASPQREDHLAARLRSLAPRFPHALRVLHHPFDPEHETPLTRGAALNSAAAAAQGHVLMVLHADTRLLLGAFDRVREAVERGAQAGAFPKVYRPDPPLLRLQAAALNAWRLHVLHQTVGTNAPWLRRALWRDLPDWPMFEDFVLSDRLRRLPYEWFDIADQPVIVSADKYVATGVLASMAINLAVISLYRLGRDPGRLYDELYSRRRLAVGSAAFWPTLLRQIAISGARKPEGR